MITELLDKEFGELNLDPLLHTYMKHFLSSDEDSVIYVLGLMEDKYPLIVEDIRDGLKRHRFKNRTFMGDVWDRYIVLNFGCTGYVFKKFLLLLAMNKIATEPEVLEFIKENITKYELS